ncbi:tRNA preQ1(34) S-adenosylmethionine ribosyltransferase-isomerase QueA [Patescibacteria group bacterium]|jgi:S-adenosylmethionine:tRNA ribosyltransferase-isomerase|nr:tRNA preQ1(34) S-adenosylmethionine ribosyltransferase-isomerase QueA [Patescibacteria group bacterium]
MDVSLFDYALPPERIAQKSMEPRDAAKLLVLDRASGNIKDKHISDLPDLLKAGDLLVFNDSRVFKARLKGEVSSKYSRDLGLKVEIFLLRPEGDTWIAMAKPGKKLHTGSRIMFADGSKATIVGKRDDGTVDIDFRVHPRFVFDLAEKLGEVPVPPYVDPDEVNTSNYQTIYAREVGSVAAPTAGFHFTQDLFKKLDEKGVKKAFVTLHVGVGTFRPIKTDTLEAHEMHEEWAQVPEDTRRAIEETKKNGGRVIVVGTTAMRALESGMESGFTKLFITPGYQFKVADGLITNFHLPKSTLIVLVSSFAGRENVMNAYTHAVENDYRFYSFGDAMLIV